MQMESLAKGKDILSSWIHTTLASSISKLDHTTNLGHFFHLIFLLIHVGHPMMLNKNVFCSLDIDFILCVPEVNYMKYKLYQD